MATVTTQLNSAAGFSSGETVTAVKLNSLVNSATVTGIVDADINSAAAIASTKLSTATQQSLVPAGAVMPFARATKPSGWLEANGDVVPNGTGSVQGITADFTALYAAVGTSFGTAGTLPNLRGIFVRGSGSQTINGTTNITYNKTFAAKEQDAFQGHRHGQQPGGGFGGGGVNAGGGSVYTGTTTETPVTDDINGTPRTASETRPANIALLYCIKF